MHAMHRRKVRECLELQYINAHHIGVLQVASKQAINAHMLGGILLTGIYKYTHTYMGYVDSCRRGFGTYVIISQQHVWKKETQKALP